MRASWVTVAAMAVTSCAHAGAGPDAGPADPDAFIVATEDAQMIERGRYIAYGPGHCVACHTPEGPLFSTPPGQLPPLIGGYQLHFRGGSVVTPNLTPDIETGIGRRTDLDLVRMLRHSRRADGSKALPIMEYQNLSDEDLRSLISFLRSQPPVSHAAPDRSINILGAIGMWLFVRARGPEGTPLSRSPVSAPTIERGAYLVHNVAACVSCHTRRGGLTASYKGPQLAGGWKMELEGDPEHEVVTPNLTPDPSTGVISRWSEQDFVDRFRKGSGVRGSHMPWLAYATMSDADLRAIYRYLRSVPPVENDTGPVLRRRPPEDG